MLEIANLVLQFDLDYLPYFMDTIIDALENEDEYIKNQGTLILLKTVKWDNFKAVLKQLKNQMFDYVECDLKEKYLDLMH